MRSASGFWNTTTTYRLVVDLRKLARGKECQLRLIDHNGYPICNYDSSTTVLAHLRRGGTGGMGKKPPDLCGIWCCSSCHDALDGRSNYVVSDADILYGLLRTLARVSEELG